MKDLNARWIKIKGLLFLMTGITAGALILVNAPDWRTAALLIVAVWSFCRFYYFAFYVIEKYVDPGFKFSGLFSFIHYILKRRR